MLNPEQPRGTLKLGKFVRALPSLPSPKCWGFTQLHLPIFHPLLILLFRYPNTYWTSLPGYPILKFIMHVRELFFSTTYTPLPPFHFLLLVPRFIQSLRPETWAQHKSTEETPKIIALYCRVGNQGGIPRGIMLLETHQNEKEHSMGMICQDRMGSAEIINSIISMAFLLIKKNSSNSSWSAFLQQKLGIQSASILQTTVLDSCTSWIIDKREWPRRTQIPSYLPWTRSVISHLLTFLLSRICSLS